MLLIDMHEQPDGAVDLFGVLYQESTGKLPGSD